MDFANLLDNLSDTGFVLFDPSKRLFWGNILGGLLFLALMPGPGKRQRFKTLFARRIWMHASSWGDLKIIAFNALLRIFAFGGSLVSATALAAGVSLLLRYAFHGRPAPLNLTLGSLLFSLTLFLADDFARFFVHYWQHRLPGLWIFHKTHHSAEVLTPLTLLRTHPVEIVMARVRNVITYGVVTGLFFYLMGEDLTAWDLLGTEILGFTFNFLGANLRHSEVWLHFGPLENVLISPAAHQVHHSTNPAHYDKNFGVALAVWDKLFKTHFDPRSVQGPLSFGLTAEPSTSPHAHSLWTQIALPCVEFKNWVKSR